MEKVYKREYIRTYEDLVEREKNVYSQLKSYKLGDATAISTKGLSERYNILMHDLGVIVELTKNHPYLYILVLTKVEEKFAVDIYDSVQEILDNYFCDLDNEANKISPDIAFACLYYLVLCEYRANKKDSVCELLKKYGPHFNEKDDYPLLYELYGRFCSLNNDSRRQLNFSEITKRACRKKGLTELNVALYAGYASAVCKMAQYCFYKMAIWKDSPYVGEMVNVSLKNDHKNMAWMDDYTKETYTYTKDDLANDVLNKAIADISKAITFNPDYPKYDFLLAQLEFYRCFYENNKITAEEKAGVIRLIEQAKCKVDKDNRNAESILNEYEKFRSIVEECPTMDDRWYLMHGFADEAAKNAIIRSSSASGVQPLVYRPETNVAHAFVSYSSCSFKQVYCDLIELRKQGILCDYDNEMEGIYSEDVNTGEKKTDSMDKQKWYSVIEEKIRASSCVICYLSEDYLISPAVLLELKFIERYNKPIIAVDLSGKRRISSLFVSIANKKKYSDKITSEILFWFAKKFDDDINVIGRQVNPLDTCHIRRMKKKIFTICPEIVNSLHAESAFTKGRGTAHKMEDHCICDDARDIYVIADGITRQNRAEYDAYGSSISKEIAKTFCEKFYDAILQSSLHVQGIKDEEAHFAKALREANEKVKDIADKYVEKFAKTFADEKGFFERPGCVCVAGAVYQDILFFASAGDCMGILVRNGKKIVFADKQTSYAFHVAGVEKDRAVLHEKYVNVSSNPFGYGVVNGEEGVNAFFNVSHLRLEFGDILYFVSDGISDYIQYGDPEKYNKLSLDKIIEKAIAEKEALNGKGCHHDDICIIRAYWGNGSKSCGIVNASDPIKK